MPSIPTVEGAVRGSDLELAYPLYKEGSQFTHGTHFATRTYRKNLGTKKRVGEWVDAASWAAPLEVCWLTLRSVGVRVIDQLGGDSSALVSRDRLSSLSRAFVALRHDVTSAYVDGKDTR